MIMCILPAIVAAVVLVTLGYFAMCNASQPNLSKGLSQFGKILAIVLFCIAGLAIIIGISCPWMMCHKGMGRCGMMGPGMDRMSGTMKMSDMGPACQMGREIGKELPPMKAEKPKK